MTGIQATKTFIERGSYSFLPLSAKWKKLVSFDVVFCDFKCTF